MRRGCRSPTGSGALLTTAPDGVSELVFRSASLTVTITSFGWRDEGILAIADGVQFARGRPRYGDDRFRSDHDLLLSRRSTGAGLATDVFRSDVVSSAQYQRADADGRPATVNITTRVADAQIDQVLAAFVVTAPVVLADTGTVFTPASSGPVVSAELTFGPAYTPRGLHLLQWTVAGRTVQLVTSLPVPELTRVLPLRLVRRGTVESWARLQRTASTAAAQPAAPFESLGAGRLEDGTSWAIDLQRERRWADAMITRPDGTVGLIQLDLSFRPCGTSAHVDVVTLVCVVPAGGATVLQIEGARGSRSVDLAAFAADDRWLGAVVDLDAGPFRARLIGPGGSTETALAVSGAST